MTRASAPAERAPRPRKFNKPDRLRSAWKLIQDHGVFPLPDGTFRVAGNEQPFYLVDLRQSPACHCKDMEFAPVDHQCKHILAARLKQEAPQGESSSLLGTLIAAFLANEDATF
jgi:hypothetical protein